MTTLITGGTGRTGGVLAKLLHAANRPFIITSRSGKAPEPFKAVTFDWFDPSTFENPFTLTDASLPKVDRVYLILPPVLDSIPVVAPFIDLAVAKGVKRFVLLASTQSVLGGPADGKVHQYILDKGVDYVVLKPTWYSQNFVMTHYVNIRENSQIQSATGDGKIPWVSTDDVAQVAFEAITADESPNKDIYILGPKLHSYDEVAQILSTVLGRQITNKKNTLPEQTAAYASLGIPHEYAAALTAMEESVAQGKEAALVDGVPEGSDKYVGKRTLEEYFKENRERWIV